ncbi:MULTISPECIES: hypothetical protein [unclassified Sporosarcina]|uniref:hypothetical protein n=1 Tax=unclassified Sporosarcina TaxID=2647733 RepID=UPI000C172CBA|nr:MULTISPECIES: hypothetical protein [unclassified Sporosarcina]PID07132.1 hypothetical protein CSV66_00690 [Sporosarcina sp. P30]PID10328.1 hypothetical protein CSV65_00695 [Sporosarcina sp. P31]PID12912.1 hypothetical protein CSV64_03275 [Sporosarcina sp. P32b]
MDGNKRLAVELAKALIQNNHVKPVFNKRYDSDTNIIVYNIEENEFSFNDIVLHFEECLKKSKEYH